MLTSESRLDGHMNGCMYFIGDPQEQSLAHAKDTLSMNTSAFRIYWFCICEFSPTLDALYAQKAAASV